MYEKNCPLFISISIFFFSFLDAALTITVLVPILRIRRPVNSDPLTTYSSCYGNLAINKFKIASSNICVDVLPLGIF